MTGARSILASLRIEDGRAWAEAATDQQHQDTAAILEGPAPFNFICRGRGWSKTTDAAAIVLAWLLTGPERARYYAAAADADQARLLLDALEGFARRTPAIGSRLKIEARRVIAAENGATIEVVPADAASSWGIKPAGVVIDEAAYWQDTPAPRQLLDSLLSSAAKVDGCRVVVITSPSSPSHFAYKLREHAASDRLWRLSETAGPPPWLDQERVEEQRRRLPEAAYRRLFLGEWVEGDEQLAVVGDVEAAITHSAPLDYDSRHRYAIGCDLGLKADRSAVAVAHLEDGERVVVDKLGLWKGSRLRPVSIGAVEEWLKATSRYYGGAPVVSDPWQAVSMLERLRGQGLKVHEFAFSQQSAGRLAGVLVDLLRGRRLALPDDEALIGELRAVRLVERSPGSFRIDHATGGHDDMVIAIALAAQHLLRKPQYPPPSTTPFHPWGRRRPRRQGNVPSARDGTSERPFLYYGSPPTAARPPTPVKNPNKRRPPNG